MGIKAKSKKKPAAPKNQRPRQVLHDTWYATVGALASAGEGVERQIKQLMKKNNISSVDASGVLKQWGSRVYREQKKVTKQVTKQLGSRLKTLESRVKKERKVLGRIVDNTVQGALSSFNIPSRQEVAELTRKVEQLSRKIDSFKAA